jgi:hypothetical protein
MNGDVAHLPWAQGSLVRIQSPRPLLVIWGNTGVTERNELSFAKKDPASSWVTWAGLPGTGDVRNQTADLRRGDKFLLPAKAAVLPVRAWAEFSSAKDGCRGGTRRIASSCAALVPMVQSTHFGEHNDGAFRRRLDASRRGRVFLEGEMGSRPVIVGDVSSKHATQMPLAQNDDVIQTLAAQGSDQSLRERILPGARRRRNDFGYAHARDTALEHVSIDGIAIAQQPSRCGVVRKGVHDLLRRPYGSGMFGDRHVDDSTAVVGEQHEHEQHAAAEGRHGEEVHRHQRRHVIRQKGSLRL